MSDVKSDAEKAADYAKSVAGDAVKAETTVKAVGSKLSTWVAAHSTQIAIGLLVVVALLVWKLI